ncbi:hypothetical protein B0J11DRAFT_135706 [Dendryphion nanum]|uniref:proline--tRNA ligase n=1 Tax=Dendryphion nanum TaxID=256645 RepID=A0A9P9D7W2_9PLEO|nr:hypothetical protein B0J11DRAFT_135706 [Dendryphion nanum]
MTAYMWTTLRRTQPSTTVYRNIRFLAIDSRNRLSRFWAPTGGISSQDGEPDLSHALLVKGGYLRQAHSGVFHLLPLGLRVQNKLEALIDKHMSSLGASKVSLSSITTEVLWKQSGRYSANSELLRLKDRRDSGFLLSPTHEEEITSLVAGMVYSYKDLPLRLYQTGRKYRDERRPRGGLLRAKEFVMKDLYTFDHSSENALQTYEEVRTAYTNFFNEFKIPYLVADADSGNMGGNLSHEYHFVSPKGEDNVWSCNCCSYVANEELVEKNIKNTTSSGNNESLIFTGISQDRSTRVEIQVPRPSISFIGNPCWSDVSKFVNLHAVKNAGIDIDAGIEQHRLQELLPKTSGVVHIRDIRLSSSDEANLKSADLTIIQSGDCCPRCDNGKLSVQKAIEVGHTFHLGTRYSSPLDALVAIPEKKEKVAIDMGCHGIGVSRILGAIASLLADEQGLNWPRVIAPFEAIVVAAPELAAADAAEVYDTLSIGKNNRNIAEIDTVVDDRPIKGLGWKLKDADLIGYPVVVILAKAWKQSRDVEVQCRRLGVKKVVPLGDLRTTVAELLKKL